MVLGTSIASEHLVDMAGLESCDGPGATCNSVIEDDLGINSLVTHAKFENVVICTVGTSWCNEAVVRFGRTDEVGSLEFTFWDGVWFNDTNPGEGIGLQAQCDEDGDGDPSNDNGPTDAFDSGGYVDIVQDAGLEAILLEDGLLRMEFYENYDDVAASVDAVFVSGTLGFLYQAEGEAALCGPSLNPLCTMDQAGTGEYSEDPDGVPESGDEIFIADIGDGSVDVQDFSALLVSFGSTSDPDAGEARPKMDGAPCDDPDDSDGTFDCYGDCEVNVSDFSALLVQFGNSGSDCGDLGWCLYTDGQCQEQTLAECYAESQPNDANISLFWANGADVTDVDANGVIDCDDAFPAAACCDSSTGTCADVNIAGCQTGEFTAGSLCADVACNLIPNDNCSGDLSAFELTLGSTTAYDTTGANTDGPANESCEFDGQVYHDVWFTVQAANPGGIRMTTCATPGTSLYDTDIHAYVFASQSELLARDCENLELAGCNDDSPGCDDGVTAGAGFHSDLTVGVEAGEWVLVRVGGWGDGDEGQGFITVEELQCDPAYERPNSCTTNPVVNNGLHGTTAFYVDDNDFIDTDADGTDDTALSFAVEFNSGDGISFSEIRLMWADLSTAPGAGTGIPGVDSRITFYDITSTDLATIDWCDSSTHPPVEHTEELFTAFGTVQWVYTGGAWSTGETCEVIKTLAAPVSIAAGKQILMVPTFYDLPASAYADQNGDGVLDDADILPHFLWNVETDDFCSPSPGPFHLVGPILNDDDGDGTPETCSSYNTDANGGDLEPDGYTSFAYQLCE